MEEENKKIDLEKRVHTCGKTISVKTLEAAFLFPACNDVKMNGYYSVTLGNNHNSYNIIYEKIKVMPTKGLCRAA